MKSGCFVLLACLTLLLGATSCSNDEFETNLPEEQRQYTKAELIEQALSRMPQTRAGAPYPVVMVTTKKTIHIYGSVIEDMVIHWGNEATTPVSKDTFFEETYTFSTDALSYSVFLEGSNQALKLFHANNDELIYLDIANNTELRLCFCESNELNSIDLTNCTNLVSLGVASNNLSSIDVTHLSSLTLLSASNNQLTSIDVSKNPNLQVFWIGQNQLTNLDVSKNIYLQSLDVAHNLITDIDLTKHTDLRSLILSGLSLNTINNHNINSTSFSIYPNLEQLDISYTPFTSLDLSNNILLEQIAISGTEITQLDVSHLQIETLDADNSKLTNLIYNSMTSLKYLVFIDIYGTPFETSASLYPLITSGLPNRFEPNKIGKIVEGCLYTSSSSLIAPLIPVLTGKNWVVAP